MDALARIAPSAALQPLLTNSLSSSENVRCCSLRPAGLAVGIAGRRTRKALQVKSEGSSCSTEEESGVQEAAGDGSLVWNRVAILAATIPAHAAVALLALADETEAEASSGAAESVTSAATDAASAVVTAASRAPSWLGPAIVAFPLFSYFLFNQYRDKVNPTAKVTDWLFGLLATAIVANIFMQAVWGVRLY